jgi:ABC-type polysaccharide/polyol phosphate transport system ATPase subunit
VNPRARLTFENVWKRFRLGHAHDSLRDLIPGITKKLLRRGAAQSPASKRDFWALKDVSFDVGPGEVLGIIGPNGAGKSTTLKLLNRIMDPTAGTVRAEGRIGALIEVSAGFHQDLTGRQNIYLQGAIMGMRKVEVERKFDEIVAFAGVEEFLDTPVKRYSSGMNARLGFAIAAHLEPDILTIDEVLSVGDASFQQKAFTRIKQMATGGAPVVLVSHQLDRIAELCTKAILLDKGIVRTTGTPVHCINTYLNSLTDDSHTAELDTVIRYERVFAPDGAVIESGGILNLVVSGHAEAANAPSSWSPALRVVESASRSEIHTITGIQRGVPLPVSGQFEYHFTLQMNVRAGTYTVYPVVWDAAGQLDPVTGPSVHVEVLEGKEFFGPVQLNAEWTVAQAAAFREQPQSRHRA